MFDCKGTKPAVLWLRISPRDKWSAMPKSNEIPTEFFDHIHHGTGEALPTRSSLWKTKNDILVASFVGGMSFEPGKSVQIQWKNSG